MYTVEITIQRTGDVITKSFDDKDKANETYNLFAKQDEDHVYAYSKIRLLNDGSESESIKNISYEDAVSLLDMAFASIRGQSATREDFYNIGYSTEMYELYKKYWLAFNLISLKITMSGEEIITPAIGRVYDEWKEMKKHAPL